MVEDKNGWSQAQEWVKRELDRLGDGQDCLNKKVDRLVFGMLAQTVVIIVAVFIELVRRHL